MRRSGRDRPGAPHRTAGQHPDGAHLAALAVEHRAGIVSYDADFGRFGVRWDRPDDLL